MGDHSHMQTNIIGVDSLDFGYPNIEYVHNGQGCYEGTLIAFNHTGFTTNAGISAIRHSNVEGESGYSNIIRLKEGDGYVRRLSGSYERWGDYFGIQAVPGHPDHVYTSGFYGTEKRSSSTWFNRISVTENTPFTAPYTSKSSDYIQSTVSVSVEPENGFAPYSILWWDGTTEFTHIFNAMMEKDAPVQISDAKGCVITEVVKIDAENLSTSTKLYPNPVTDEMNVTFYVKSNTKGSFGIYDMVGKLVVNLGELDILEGANSFTFSTRPLLKGTYIFLIKDGSDNNITKQSFIKL